MKTKEDTPFDNGRVKTDIDKFEYYVQKHNISPKSLDKFKNNYDEDDYELQEQLNSMGGLGWELCSIINHVSDINNSKFIYRRKSQTTIYN